MTEWVDQKLKIASKLSPLLELAARMISVEPKDRPVVDAVVQEVAAAGNVYFCTLCWQDVVKCHPAIVKTKDPEPLPLMKLTSVKTFPENKLDRVESAARRKPVGGFLERVDSATLRPQLQRFFSRDSQKEARKDRLLNDDG